MQTQTRSNSTWRRMLRHLLIGRRQALRRFPPASLQAIESAIRQGESTHHAEIRLVVEAALSMQDIWLGLSPRQRAQQLFAQLGVWDTAHNSGILLYINLADHQVEILVDRGLAACTTPAAWQNICDTLTAGLNPQHPADLQTNVLQAIAATHAIARQHFPVDAAHPPEQVNTLVDAPLVI